MKRFSQRFVWLTAVIVLLMNCFVFQSACAMQTTGNGDTSGSVMQARIIISSVVLGIALIVVCCNWIMKKIKEHKLEKQQHEARTWVEETVKTRLNEKNGRSFRFTPITCLDKDVVDKEYAEMKREVALWEEQEAIERERNMQKRKQLYGNGERSRQTTTTSNGGYRKRDDRNDFEEKNSYHHEDILMYGTMLFDTSESESHDTSSSDYGGFDDSSDTSSSDDFDFGGFDGDSDGGGASDDF